MIDRIGRIQGVQSGISPEVPAAAKAGGDTFGAVFQRELERTQSRQVAFSKHAMARAEERGIEVTDTLLDRLTDSVERAQSGLYHQCPQQPGHHRHVPRGNERKYLYQHRRRRDPVTHRGQDRQDALGRV